MASKPLPQYTLEEYLAQERVADSKSEFYAGHILAMAGGTETHALIAAQVVFLFKSRLESCRVYGSDLQVYSHIEDRCVYPDAMAICGSPVFLDERKDVVTNPTLIVEVLSPSSELRDQGTKSILYRNLASLSHYLLIAQDRIYVEHSSRQSDGSWLLENLHNLSDSVRLTGVGDEFSLRDIYSGVGPFSA